METNINEDELTLLSYLHENAKGYGRRFALDADEVAEQLTWSQDQFCKAASYLAEWDLVVLADDIDDDPMISFVALAGEGENYMRELEKRLADQTLLGRGKRATLAGITGLVKTARDAVIQAG